MLHRKHINRLNLVVVLGFICWSVLVGRLFSIQVKDGRIYRKRAKEQHLRYIRLGAERGIIYDRNFNELAVNLSVDSFGADPLQVENPEVVAKRFSEVTGVAEGALYQKLKGGKSFVWLARRVDPRTSQRIRSWGLKGIHAVTEARRYYPLGPLAGQVVGFTDIDNRGLEGVELGLDELLRGTPGWSILQMDARGHRMPGFELPKKPPQNGCDVVLTLDAGYQSIVEGGLSAAVKRFQAKGGMAIVMNPKTGEILAMANEPGFDPNRFGQFDPELRRNRTVTDVFEPGSTFKIVTGAAALEMGTKRPDELIFAENGEIRVAGAVIHDSGEYGWLTFRQAIEKSSNIAVLKTAQELGRKGFYEYARAFGFGCLTGVEFPGEVQGVLRNPAYWSRRSLATLSIGYEVSVTALQLVNAYSAIANRGLLMEPKLVKAVIDPEGNVVERVRPTVIRRVVSEDTARLLTGFLCGVVEQGTGVKARIKGVKVAGKTGTAMKARVDGHGYDSTKFVSSFVGFLPADDPQLVGLVVIDEPKGVYWGSEVAAPIFRRIMTRIIDSQNGLWGRSTDLSAELLARGEVHRSAVRGEVSGISPARRLTHRFEREKLEKYKTMPRLLGMSLRRAVRQLAIEGIIGVKISGSGVVKDQYPPPGSRMGPGERCRLRCEPYH